MRAKKTLSALPPPQAGRARAAAKHATSFKLTSLALDILSTLSRKRGIAKSALIENLLRDAWDEDRNSKAKL